MWCLCVDETCDMVSKYTCVCVYTDTCVVLFKYTCVCVNNDTCDEVSKYLCVCVNFFVKLGQEVVNALLVQYRITNDSCPSILFIMYPSKHEC